MTRPATKIENEYNEIKNVLPIELTQEQFKKIRRDYQMVRNTNNSRRVDANGNLIEFRLSFQEWLNIWTRSGHLMERGRKFHQYVMSRYNDIGHYEPNNVFIQSQAENHKEYRERKIRHVYANGVIYATQKDAAKALGIHPMTIIRWLRDPRKENIYLID